MVPDYALDRQTQRILRFFHTGFGTARHGASRRRSLLFDSVWRRVRCRAALRCGKIAPSVRGKLQSESSNGDAVP